MENLYYRSAAEGQPQEWVKIGRVKGDDGDYFDVQGVEEAENVLRIEKRQMGADGSIKGEWELVGTVTAPQGEQGADGAEGGKGDYYNVRGVGEAQNVLRVEKRLTGADGQAIGNWELVGTVTAPQGEQGEQGEQGADGADGADGDKGDYYNVRGVGEAQNALRVEKRLTGADGQVIGNWEAIGTVTAPQGADGGYYVITGETQEQESLGGTDLYLYRQLHDASGNPTRPPEYFLKIFLEYGKSLLSVGYYALSVREEPAKHLRVEAQWWCATNLEPPLIFEPQGEPIHLGTFALPAGPPTELNVTSSFDWVQLWGDINGNGLQQMGIWQRALRPVLTQDTFQKTITMTLKAYDGQGGQNDVASYSWKDANYTVESARLSINGQTLLLYVTRLDGAGEITASTVTLPSANFKFNSNADGTLFLLQKQDGANWNDVSSWYRAWFTEYYKYWIAPDTDNPNKWGLIQQRYLGGTPVGDADKIFEYNPQIESQDYEFCAAEMGNLDVQDVGIGLRRVGQQEILSKFDYHLSIGVSGESLSFWRRINDSLSQQMISRNIGYDFEKTVAGKIRITRKADNAVIFEDCCGSEGGDLDWEPDPEDLLDRIKDAIDVVDDFIKAGAGGAMGAAIGAAGTTAVISGGSLVLSVLAGVAGGVTTNLFSIPVALLQEAVGGGGGGGGGGGTVSGRTYTSDELKKIVAATHYAVMAWIIGNRDGHMLVLPPKQSWDSIGLVRQGELYAYCYAYINIINPALTTYFSYAWNAIDTLTVVLNQFCAFLIQFAGVVLTDWELDVLHQFYNNVTLAQTTDTLDQIIAKMAIESMRTALARGFNMVICYDRLLSFSEMTQLEPIFDCGNSPADNMIPQSYDFRSSEHGFSVDNGFWQLGIGFVTNATDGETRLQISKSINGIINRIDITVRNFWRYNGYSSVQAKSGLNQFSGNPNLGRFTGWSVGTVLNGSVELSATATNVDYNHGFGSEIEGVTLRIWRHVGANGQAIIESVAFS